MAVRGSMTTLLYLKRSLQVKGPSVVMVTNQIRTLKQRMAEMEATQASIFREEVSYSKREVEESLSSFSFKISQFI